MAHNFNCLVDVCVSCQFLVMPWIGLHTVVVAFPGHRPAHFLKDVIFMYFNRCSDLN